MCLEYDDILNSQRTAVYRMRDNILKEFVKEEVGSKKLEEGNQDSGFKNEDLANKKQETRYKQIQN